jgi:EpsD family peptidyl-prolyl cis-trans isomerase
MNASPKCPPGCLSAAERASNAWPLKLTHATRSLSHGTGLLLFALCACVAHASDAPIQSDVVAKVGNVPITRQELDLAWGRMAPPDTPPEQASAQKRALLAERVRLEALAQRAQAENLDAGPTYEAELVSARRRILASLVERKAVAGAPEVTPAQVRMVIEGSPWAFRDRQLLTIEELTLPLPPEPLASQLVQAAQHGEGFEHIEGLLNQAHVVPQRRVYTAGTDQLRPQLLRPLLAAKPGEALVGRMGPNQLQIMVMRLATPAPLDDEAATAAATAVLNAQLRQRAVQQRVQQVVAQTPIEYFGEFAKAAQPEAAEQPVEPASGLELAPDFAGGDAGAKTALPGGLAKPEPWSRWRLPGVAGLLVAASALALLLWVMVVRLWVGTLWMPVVWPRRRAGSSPGLAVLLAQHVLRQKGGLQPKIRLFRWIQLTPVLAAGLMFWPLLQSGLDRLGPWVVAACAGAGLVLGLLAAHAFALSRWRTATRQRLWLPVLLVALFLALISRAALLLV